MAFTYSKLAESTVGAGGTTTVTFNNIPQNYTDLVIKISARAATDTQSAPTMMTFNGITTGYTSRRILGTGGSVISQTGTQTGVLTTGSDFTASTFGSGEVYISNYSSASAKSISSDSTNENNATGCYMASVAGAWSNTSPITSITFTQEVGNTAQHSTFTLYGIRAEV
jgi:hypothetical protein